MTTIDLKKLLDDKREHREAVLTFYRIAGGALFLTLWVLIIFAAYLAV